MENIKTDLLPLDVCDSPWLYEKKPKCYGGKNIGKWMLFYDKKKMNDNWILAKKLYRENKLDDVLSMKCSTNYDDPRASTKREGVIILYCSDSSNEEKIINIGKNILEMFDYKEKQIIYYKTDLQTKEGTISTGNKKNHTYKLLNHLYAKKCKILYNNISYYKNDINSLSDELYEKACNFHMNECLKNPYEHMSRYERRSTIDPFLLEYLSDSN